MVESKESGRQGSAARGTEADGPDRLTGRPAVASTARSRCPSRGTPDNCVALSAEVSRYRGTMCTVMPPPVLTAPDRVACEAEALAKLSTRHPYGQAIYLGT